MASEIVCTVPIVAFTAGQTALLMLTSSDELYFHSEDYIVFVQVHGYLQCNNQWIRSPELIASMMKAAINSELQHFDHNHNRPTHPLLKGKSPAEYSTCCIYSTAKVPISPSAIEDKGAIVEFQVPNNCLPSFKGRSHSIQYFCTVTMQGEEVSKIFHFPVSIINSQVDANDANFCQPNKAGGILSYSPDDILDEIFNDTSTMSLFTLSSLNDLSSSNNQQQLTASGVNKMTYKISDKAFICLLSVNSTVLIAGTVENIWLDFQEQQQQCRAVKVALIQRETELSDRLLRNPISEKDQQELVDNISFPHIVNEKVIVADLKYSSLADSLILSLPIPDSTLPGFAIPTLEVTYYLKVDFYTVEVGASEDPMSFNIDVTIHSDSMQQVGATMEDSGSYYAKMVQLCVQSQRITIPFIEMVTT